MTPQETDPDMPVSVQESLVKAWVNSQADGIQQSWEPWHAGINPFDGGSHYHSLTSGQTTGREHSPTHQQKIGFHLLSTAPPTRARPSLPHSQSFPSGSFFTQASDSHLDGRQNEKHNHRKLTKLITWITV